MPCVKPTWQESDGCKIRSESGNQFSPLAQGGKKWSGRGWESRRKKRRQGRGDKGLGGREEAAVGGRSSIPASRPPSLPPSFLPLRSLCACCWWAKGWLVSGERRGASTISFQGQHFPFSRPFQGEVRGRRDRPPSLLWPPSKRGLRRCSFCPLPRNC